MTRFSFCIMLLVAVPAAAQNGIVVDHSASRTRGLPSDTAVAVPGGGDPWWHLSADDVTLDASATIRRIAWWGLYEDDALPAVEVMRVRFYDARPDDGLPGSVLFEENLFDPLRTPTGIIVPPAYGTSFPGGAEYHFEADLTVPISLSAGTPYWMEIVQFGDPDSLFYWRGATGDQMDLAFTNPHYPDWTSFGGYDLAFQLSTVPEPGTLTLIVVAGALVVRRGRLPRR